MTRANPSAASAQRPTIAVVGATGFTGRLVVAALAADGGAELRLVGRDAARLRDAASGATDDCRAVGWTRRELAAALDGCAAVISCAGPFAEIGIPVVEAAVEVRAHYVDSTGEQTFIRAVYESLDRRAARAGVVVAPAFGFDYVPGDLGAAIAAEGLGALRRVDVVYAVERADTSVGTRRSALGMLGIPGYQFVEGRLQAQRVGAQRRSVPTAWGRQTAGSIAGGEPLMVPRHLTVDTVVGYIALPGPLGPTNPAAALLPLAARVPGLRAVLDAAARRGPAGPDAQARSSRVACIVVATARSGPQRAVRVEGRDAYGFTARSLATVAGQLARGDVDAAGACSPAEVVDARGFLAATDMSVVEIDPAAVSTF